MPKKLAEWHLANVMGQELNQRNGEGGIMFSRLFPARIRGISLALKRTKGNDEEEALCLVTLQYDLTEDLAGAIGGPALQMQQMLAQGGDGVKVARAGLVLDTKEVAITMKGADRTGLKIERTSRLKAKARQANAEDTGPTLEALAAFRIDNDEPLSFLRCNLGQLVKVRLDKRQLEIVETKSEQLEDPEEDPDQEDAN